jgi:hypothetical protein
MTAAAASADELTVTLLICIAAASGRLRRVLVVPSARDCIGCTSTVGTPNRPMPAVVPGGEVLESSSWLSAGISGLRRIKKTNCQAVSAYAVLVPCVVAGVPVSRHRSSSHLAY